MSALLASIRVETRRLIRSGLLMGLLAAFAFFGLLGPVMALYMPQILSSATGTAQLTIQAAPASASDGIMLFNQSAMQLGLILAVAVAITSLSWDGRAGSSVFYRTRVRSLVALTLPRLAVDWIAAIAAYSLGIGAAAIMTNLSIGQVNGGTLLRIWFSSAVYLVFAMSVGYLIMGLFRRTAAALAVATILILILPLMSQLDAIAAWTPTTLLSASNVTVSNLLLPAISAVIVTAACVFTVSFVGKKQTLRREA